MAKIITGVQGFYDKYDVSGIATAFSPNFGLDILEHRPFNSTSVKKDPGLYSFDGTFEAVLPFGATDPGGDFYSNIGSKKPASFHMKSSSASKDDDSLFFNGVQAQFQGGARQGDLRTVQLSMSADGPGIWGKVLEIGTKTVTGDGGTGITLPAVADGQTVYVVLHCTASSGTFDATVVSDSTDAFSSATTRFTFTQVADSTPTSEFLSLKQSGGITDTEWRLEWTSASTPSHAISVSIGIV